MIGKRGQITLMVIIGIILLFAVSIILYLQADTVNRQLQAQADESINDFLELTSINYYVTSCLDKVSAEGLTLLTEQGGVIYENQGGLYPNPSIEGINYMPYNFTYEIIDENNVTINKSYIRNVSYVIQDSLSCPGSYIRPIIVNFSNENTSFYPAKRVYFDDYTTRYAYPWFTQPITGCNSLGLRTSQMSGYFGANNLPKLCSYDGLNSKYALDENSCGSNEMEYSFELRSIQRQLEHYVKENLQNCINFSNYESISQYNISVDQNNVNVSSILQKPKGLMIIAQYPFSVALENKAPIIRQVDFQTTLDLNVRRLYTFIYSAIRSMVKIPGYNLARDYTLTQHFLPIFNVEVEEKACEKTCENPRNFDDDIIKFSDKTSIIKGKPLEFTFAVRQRKPALDYMHDKMQATFLFGNPIDYMYFTNATITIDPHAVDPDGDNITYNYSGWKETEDSWFNYTCCVQKNCTINNHTACMVNYTLQPHNWTKSSQFIASNRSAQYQTNDSDVGYHEVLVSVMDEHGAQDFQIVRYLIFDLPIARLEGNNSYDDVNDSFASVEDIYYLNGSKSQASVLAGGQISSFIFNDNEEFEPNNISPFEYLTTDSWITLPVTDYNFSNITEEVFSNYSLKYPIELKSKLHRPFLVVAQNTDDGIIYSGPSYVDVQVSECLLHRYNNDSHSYEPYERNTYTYPGKNYHWGQGNNDEDYFNAPHVCCNPEPGKEDINASVYGGGFYKLSSQNCLEIPSTLFETCYPMLGEYDYMKRSLVDVNITTALPLSEQSYYDAGYTQDYYDKFFPTGYDVDIASVNSDDLNNIYKVSFTQSCSGFRGNTCGGEFTVNWQKIVDCNDKLLPGQFASCQAPSADFVDCVGENVLGVDATNHLYCDNLSRGESFEKDWISNELYDQLVVGTNYENEISHGFCAIEKKISVNVGDNHIYQSTTNPGNQYKCLGTCDSSNGECNYENLNGECYCDTNSACSDVKASDLFTGLDLNIFGNPNKGKFFCLVDNRACDYNCSVKQKTTTEEGCYCQVQPVGGINTYEYLENTFDYFFDAVSFSSAGSYCCTLLDPETITRRNSNPANGQNACYLGNKKSHASIFYSNNPSGSSSYGNMLTCDGRFYCCSGGSINCPANSPPGVNVLASGSVCSKTCSGNGIWS